MGRKFDLSSLMETVSNLDTTAAAPSVQLIPLEDILDNKATANDLTDQMLVLIIEALIFGLVISILLSFLLFSRKNSRTFPSSRILFPKY